MLHGASALLWGRGWQRAVIEAREPASDMSRYHYACRLLDAPPGAPAEEAVVRKTSSHLRRTPTIVLAHDDYFRSDLTQGRAPPETDIGRGRCDTFQG